MNILIYCFLSIFILFPSIGYTKYKDSEYKGKNTLIDKKISKNVGRSMEWLLDCGGHGKKIKKFDKEIKSLSYADYRKVRQGRAEWNSNPKVAIQCSYANDNINFIQDYVNELRSKVTTKNATTTSKKKDTKNKQTKNMKHINT